MTTSVAKTIDILLPFYGDVSLLKYAIKSIRAQTDSAWCLLVIDDHYPDESVADWVSDLQDSRITYIRNSSNLGANANYMKALSLATADLVVFMGADDLMRPNYIRLVRHMFEAFPRAAVVQPGVSIVDANGNCVTPLADRIKSYLAPHSQEPVEVQGEIAVRQLMRGNWTYFPSLCWRRNAIIERGFRPEFHVVQDLALILDLLIDGHSLAFTPVPSFKYRRHDASDSAVKGLTGQRFVEERQLFRSTASRCATRGWPRAARAARAHSSSRANALSLLPRALRLRDARAINSLLRHALLI